MGVRLFMRMDGKSSLFRDYLIKMISCHIGDSLLLCSGYIINSNDVRNEIAQAIIKGCKPSGSVTLVAGKLSSGGSPDWKKNYRDFAKFLRDTLKGTHIAFRAVHAPQNNWHAKMAFKIDRGIPRIALLGSSNLTRPAFSTSVKNWNYESDVLIWDSAHDPKGKKRLHFHGEGLIPSSASSDDFELELMVPEGRRSELDEIKKLYDAILGLELEEFPLDEDE